MDFKKFLNPQLQYYGKELNTCMFRYYCWANSKSQNTGVELKTENRKRKTGVNSNNAKETLH